ncbi:hypothetical protein D3C81_1283030 [compost metagenome]
MPLGLLSGSENEPSAAAVIEPAGVPSVNSAVTVAPPATAPVAPLTWARLENVILPATGAEDCCTVTVTLSLVSFPCSVEVRLTLDA